MAANTAGLNNYIIANRDTWPKQGGGTPCELVDSEVRGFAIALQVDANNVDVALSELNKSGLGIKKTDLNRVTSVQNSMNAHINLKDFEVAKLEKAFCPPAQRTTSR